MKIGAVFPHLEIGNDPAVIKDWAQTAEGLGYSHLLVYDHVLGAIHADRDPPLWGPYSEQSGTLMGSRIFWRWDARCALRYVSLWG